MREILPVDFLTDNLDPFDLPANPADWPPTDPQELEALELFFDQQEELLAREREAVERIGHNYDHEEA